MQCCMAFDLAKMRSPTQGIKLILKDVLCNRVMALDNARMRHVIVAIEKKCLEDDCPIHVTPERTTAS